jgi:amino acid adenylation domain-containing protein
MATNHGLLFEPFLKQVSIRPDQIAVISASRRLSYLQLFAAGSRLASRLRELGVEPNELVPVVMKKGWEQVVAVLAIQLAGAAYLPIDPSWPEERRHHLLSVSEARVLLTQPDLASSLVWPEDVRVWPVDPELLEDGPVPTLEPVQTADDLAYVIFTSGSTGQPKGVMIDHKGALNTILDINERFSVGVHDRVLALSALSFDLSVYDIFGPLAAGGAIVLPVDDDKRDPRPWLDIIRKEQVTLWNTVPALMEMLVSTRGWEQSCESLRLALLSGDWIPISLPERIWAGSPRMQLISLGGATEASIWSVLYQIESVHPSWTSIPYGQAMKDQTIEVLDSELRRCSALVPGEIYIGGIGLAKGYFKNQLITAERFITHPETGARLYRTGDLGRYLPSGDIEFLGREDLQVKINGFRIEISEVETALAKHPGVNACAVAVLGQHGTPKRLAACVVGPNLDTEELRRFLSERIPEYMVPHIWKELPTLPLSSNGKIDRKALAQLSTPSGGATSSASEEGLEAQVKAIWMRALNLGSLSSSDGFLDVGGDSLSALEVIAEVSANLQADVPLRFLFDNPDIQAFAAEVALHQNSSQQV